MAIIEMRDLTNLSWECLPTNTMVSRKVGGQAEKTWKDWEYLKMQIGGPHSVDAAGKKMGNAVANKHRDLLLPNKNLNYHRKVHLCNN